LPGQRIVDFLPSPSAASAASPSRIRTFAPVLRTGLAALAQKDGMRLPCGIPVYLVRGHQSGTIEHA
jgi:hypothetical protein